MAPNSTTQGDNLHILAPLTGTTRNELLHVGRALSAELWDPKAGILSQLHRTSRGSNDSNLFVLERSIYSSAGQYHEQSNIRWRRSPCGGNLRVRVSQCSGRSVSPRSSLPALQLYLLPGARGIQPMINKGRTLTEYNCSEVLLGTH